MISRPPFSLAISSGTINAMTHFFTPFEEKMRAEGLPDVAIRTFRHYYEQLVEGSTGHIQEAEIDSVQDLPEAESFSGALTKIGEAATAQTVFIKLNGGLGTSMGLERAKSLLTVKDDLSFLDIIARQAIETGAPLLLMNSFNTREDSLKVLENYAEIRNQEIGVDFVQHKVPKVLQADLSPAVWPDDPTLEWCPPGHGDIYTALVTSGALERLLENGYRYAFVSNSDNLGAVLEPAILGYFVDNDLPFLMEVTERTEADKKGGHLARRKSDGQLILREIAQTPPEDRETFQDITYHQYFNCNNLWFNLEALRAKLAAQDGILGLSLIRNEKTLDPRDPESPAVYQLETAMGSAIAVFEGAEAVRVPRTRLVPVKTTDDLLVVRSDAYTLTDHYRIVLDPARSHPKPPIVSLDPEFYTLIDQMEARLPGGAPSLIDCVHLDVDGDVAFGEKVICKGEVHVVNERGEQVRLSNETLKGTIRYNSS